MEHIDAGGLAERTFAEARVDALLLKELMAGLEARGILSRSDIAGALLRMEVGAKIADRVDDAEGAITHHAEIATQTIDEWQSRFGLPAELYTLRTRQSDWELAQERASSPLEPEQVIAFYSTPED
ncbi:hypothetical protein CQ054_06015 [Ochrobactrum sp. MYb29]|nr:hypothetical protein CQ054_06015 [Ochrobactrum sp. MYb29]